MGVTDSSTKCHLTTTWEKICWSQSSLISTFKYEILISKYFIINYTIFTDLSFSNYKIIIKYSTIDNFICL